MLPLNVACCGLLKSGATSALWGGRGAGVWDITGQTMPASDSIKFIYIIICVHLVLIYDLCSDGCRPLSCCRHLCWPVTPATHRPAANNNCDSP